MQKETPGVVRYWKRLDKKIFFMVPNEFNVVILIATKYVLRTFYRVKILSLFSFFLEKNNVFILKILIVEE